MKSETMEQMTGSLREKLTPVIQSALQEHCGESCPGFRVDPQFKKAAASEAELEDLGFVKAAETETASAPELKAISVSVLVHDRAGPKERDSLKQILSQRLANESTVPVSVQLKSMSSASPMISKRAEIEAQSAQAAKMELVKASVWPASILLVALLSFVVALLFFRNRRLLQRDRMAARAAKPASPEIQVPVESPASEERALARKLLEEKLEDLQWWIEERAGDRDMAALGGLLSVFDSNELTTRVRLSPRALRAMAVASSQGSPARTGSFGDRVQSLREALSQVHWRRLAERQDPLTRLGRLNDRELANLQSRLHSLDLKATLMAALAETRWPALLGELSSSDRVELGLAISRLSQAAPEQRQALETILLQEAEALLQQGKESAPSAVLESYSLYLSEKEGQKLWQDLSAQSLARSSASAVQSKPHSIDSLVQVLKPEALLEICTSIDIKSLQVLLVQSSPESQARIRSVLPKTLRERLEQGASQSSTHAEAQLIRARAELFGAYRRMETSS